MTTGGAHGIHTENIFSDLQVDVIVPLVTGSTSASSSCRRRSVGRLRHLHMVARPSCSQGLLHSAVQQEDHTRKEAVKKLIHQFETHPHREALKADLRQNHAYNPFSEQSKEIYNMGNMEYFEMCEITSKVQCPHCTTYWTKSIVYCTCGTCLRPSDKTLKLNKDRFNAMSIPNDVIKKGSISRCTSRKHREANNVPRSSHLSKQSKEKGLQLQIGQTSELPNLQSITDPDRMGRRTLRTLRCNCSRRSLIHRYSGREQKTYSTAQRKTVR